jgi:succinyl-CoA synthetase beta subunit
VLLIEADGKALLAEHGVVVPEGVLVTHTQVELSGIGPWMVKAQVPVGGRGKAGGVVRCSSPRDVAAAVGRLLGTRLRGHQVEACLIEQVAAGEERYLGVMVDAASYGLRVIYSKRGASISSTPVQHRVVCAHRILALQPRRWPN